jgi:hypothetical protein
MTHKLRSTSVPARVVAVATVVSALVATAASPAPSSAAAEEPQWNRVGFSINPSAGVWTRERPVTFVRTKTEYGSIVLSVNNNVGGGLCVRLLAAKNGSQLGYVRCWGAGSYGRKTMATNVLPNTRFTVWATKLRSASTNNYWGGSLHY